MRWECFCVALFAAVQWGCAEPPAGSASAPLLPSGTGEPSPYEPLSPTRGYVVISVDTLRADHLGAYGHRRETSPTLDALASRGVVFEHAFAHAPSTLISHMSMFTGLHPGEHGVIPPGNNVLAPGIPTLPELFQAHGFRTAGHTEGGYMHGAHGFRRGFEVFSDDPFQASTDVETTFDRGLDFLRGLESQEPFFLFLHTYSVHDPYFPPEGFRGLFEDSPPEDPSAVAAEHLSRVNEGRRALEPGEAELLAGQYDGGIRYLDEVLGRFVAGLEALGLVDEITLVITSDHGEELGDHGRLLHTQVYPETLRVPLVVLHPELDGGRRVADVVRLVDLAPTLWELAEIPRPEHLAGRSLVPFLAGAAQVPPRIAHGEVAFLDVQRSLVAEVEGEIFQLVEIRPLADPDGAWIRREVTFDHDDPTLGLRLLSFHRPRTVGVSVDGRSVEELEVYPDRWTDVRLELPARRGAVRVRLTVDGCISPESVGLGEDPRCLGFKMADTGRRRLELFRLSDDPEARMDLSRLEPQILRLLARELDRTTFEPVAEPGRRPMSPEERKALEALGYV